MKTAPATRPAAPPAEGGLSFAEAIEHEAGAFRSRGTDLGRFLADELERVAQLVRFTRGASPAEHRDRLEAWDRDNAEDHARRAYAAGYDHGRREGRDLAFAEITTVLKRSAGIR